MPKLNILHYLFMERADKHVAHCLDFDIVTTGKDFDQARDRLNALVRQHVIIALKAGNQESLQTSAPKEYWDAMKSATKLGFQELVIEDVPQILPSSNKPKGELPVLAATA